MLSRSIYELRCTKVPHYTEPTMKRLFFIRMSTKKTPPLRFSFSTSSYCTIFIAFLKNGVKQSFSIAQVKLYTIDPLIRLKYSRLVLTINPQSAPSLDYSSWPAFFFTHKQPLRDDLGRSPPMRHKINKSKGLRTTGIFDRRGSGADSPTVVSPLNGPW